MPATFERPLDRTPEQPPHADARVPSTEPNSASGLLHSAFPLQAGGGRRVVGRTRRPGRSEHHLPLGATFSFRCLARWPKHTATVNVPTGGWTKRTRESAGASITSIAASTDPDRSSTPMLFRRRAIRLPRAGFSSGQSLPAARRHVGSSLTKPPPTRQP